MKKIITLALAIWCTASWAQNLTNIGPSNSNILVEGRTVPKGEALEYCYPGTAFSIKFDGAGDVSARLKSNAGYYAVSIDGSGFSKFSTHDGQSDNSIKDYKIASNLPAGIHTIKLMLVTEEYDRFPEFHGFSLASDAKLLKPDTKKRLKIEFIGNSITCGYGNEASSADDHFADSTSNFAKSFAGLTIKNLNAVSMVVARSGIGIYKNFGDTIAGSQWPMPRVYETALINNHDSKWDFSTWKPDVVVLGLGTNDLSENNYSNEKFRLAYVAFVKNIRKHYPNANIVLLNSPMLHGQQAYDLQEVINNTITAMRMMNDAKVFPFTFQEQDASLGYGADWHPSAKRAQEMSRYLTYFIKTQVAKKFFKE
ncbi:MAG: GDSL-type esterase/lipase family protein [Bacteroidales bacterium]|nr:GDSL-type esterase/lipase family protein [Bacteroidales bacterium]